MDFKIQGTAEPNLIKVDMGAPEETGYSDFGESKHLYSHAFKIKQADAAKVTVFPGTVNGVTPTIGGTPLTDDTPPQLDLSGLGTQVAVALYGTVEVSDPVDFGNLLTIVIQAYPVATLPDTSFEHPIKRIGLITLEDGAIKSVSQEVNTSLDLVRWYDTNIWLPGGSAT